MARACVMLILCLFVIGAVVGLRPPRERPSEPRANLGAESGHSSSESRRTNTAGQTSFLSPHASPIVVHDGLVFVVNTPSDTLDVIDSSTRSVVARVRVGIDPVAVAVRPDGTEIWVSNHVSDSVSVIDSVPTSQSYLQVVGTIQDLDPETRATRFDEPVGIAFANDSKAYVALSSENKIAVIDVATRQVSNTLEINAQDPRALVVRHGRLYVIPFESNNKTQLSGGTGDLDGDLTTFDAQRHVIDNNNVLSIGAVSDIVKHPRVPDRDLFVFDIATDELVDVADSVGTLLYGLAVDSQGTVFVAQTDARNDANGRAGTQGHGLDELENRAFLNRVTSVSFEGDAAQEPSFIDLEPLPPQHPPKEEAVATPFAIEVADNDSVLLVTAAGSDKLISIDATTGEILGRVDVDAVPRGIALVSADDGSPMRAWIFNAVANTVSFVDVSRPQDMQVLDSIALEDPTDPAFKRGRIAFNTASASTTGTFSCASCHPDGHTDQLLWVLKTPVVSGGDQIMPRSTMPIRGLRDTFPFHWDGIPGDPYGGNNSANVWGQDPPNSDIEKPESTTRHLIDGGLATTMMLVGDQTTNDEGKAGELTAAERDDMATFILNVPYPPAQRRSYTNELSDRAKRGFELFHISGDHQGEAQSNVCGDCHRMPFWVSTNTPGTGMDAPTWRGAYDRFLILPQGRLNLIDFDFYRSVAERGIPERNVWQFSWAGRRRFDPVWEMVVEGSTGVSGTFGRQVTLDQLTYNDEQTLDLIDALETAASEGAVVLEADGMLLQDDIARSLNLHFVDHPSGGGYATSDDAEPSYSRGELIELARQRKFIGTFTARQGANMTIDRPQPAIWTLGPIEQQRGHQEFPILTPNARAMTVSGRHIESGAHVIVDGRRQPGTVSSDDETVIVELEDLPAAGMHFLQIQNPEGLFSNDFIFYVADDESHITEIRRDEERSRLDPRSALGNAIAMADLEETKRLVETGRRINARQPNGGSTPLSTAALHGHVDIVEFLLESGANVDATNDDGNTPLHVAAFLCRKEIVELLLEHGASITKENNRGETPVDVVSGEWNDGLSEFYQGIARSIGREFDLNEIRRLRPVMVRVLTNDGDD